MATIGVMNGAVAGMMNAEEFRLTAEKALNSLPDKFRMAMENVVIVTEELADDHILQKMQMDSPYDLLGLYEGAAMIGRSTSDSGVLPDMIYLYRQPILAACRDSGDSPDQCIADVLVHEIGHYFGFSDAEMDVIEQLGDQQHVG